MLIGKMLDNPNQTFGHVIEQHSYVNKTRVWKHRGLQRNLKKQEQLVGPDKPQSPRKKASSKKKLLAGKTLSIVKKASNLKEKSVKAAKKDKPSKKDKYLEENIGAGGEKKEDSNSSEVDDHPS